MLQAIRDVLLTSRGRFSSGGLLLEQIIALEPHAKCSLSVEHRFIHGGTQVKYVET